MKPGSTLLRVLVLCLFWLWSPEVHAQIYSVSLKLINEVTLPVSPLDIWISDGKAYIVGSAGVAVADISDPYNIPYPVFYDKISNSPSLIAVMGYYGYIAESGNTIKIVNFKDPHRPKSEGEIEVPGEVKRITINGGYLYFIRENFGLHIYDISIPSVPIFKGNQLVVGDANGLFVNSKYAYVTSETGNLTIIDITDPSSLPIAGNYNWGINFYDIYVDNKLAYVPQGATGVQVIDVSKLPTPVWVTNIYSRKSSRQVVVSGYYTIVNDDVTVQVFYNKEPKNQLFAGSFDNMGPVINKIEVVDNKFIFVCSSDQKLKAVQMSTYY